MTRHRYSLCQQELNSRTCAMRGRIVRPAPTGTPPPPLGVVVIVTELGRRVLMLFGLTALLPRRRRTLTRTIG